MLVSGILTKSFPDIFNVEFTRQMEEELETIATGERTYKKSSTIFIYHFTLHLKAQTKSLSIKNFN